MEAVERLVQELCGGSGESSPSEEAFKNFAEAQRQLTELEPVADKFRRKCQARADLEALKEQLREKVPGQPEDAIKAAEEVVNESGPDTEALKATLAKCYELQSVATYGAKMAKQVEDLLVRLDGIIVRFQAEVVPRLGTAAAEADADKIKQREAAEREAAAAAEAEARRAAEEARRPVEQLMVESELRLQAQREAQAEAERKRAEEEAARKKVEEAAAAEEEMLRKEEEDGERRLVEVGPNVLGGEALVAMLASPVGPYREAIEALHGMLQGIASEPQDVRLRLIRTSNEGYQKRLARHPGARVFLRCVGFQSKTRESLPVGLAAAVGLGVGPPSEMFLLLQEPDMMTAYEEWISWHERLKAIANFLDDLQGFIFRRTAQLGQQGLDVPAKGAVPASDVLQRWQACIGG